MIFSFLIGGKVVRYKIDAERRCWMSGPATNGEWISFRDGIERTAQGGKNAEIQLKIIAGEPLSMEEVEHYFVDQVVNDGRLRLHGVKHLGTAYGD